MNRVISVERVDCEADVYDIHVPGPECYYLESGHLVHNSRPQIAEALGKLGVDTGVKTGTGKMSTSEKALESCSHPIAQDIVTRSKLAKAKGSYVEKLSKSDWTRFNFLIYQTSTGRFASNNKEKSGYFLSFNAQNITKPKTCLYNAEYTGGDGEYEYMGWRFVPIEKFEDGDYVVEGYSQKLNVRRALTVPSPEWYFGSIDFSQEELMLAAMFSREPVLMEAFRKGEDSHRAVALQMFGAENYDKDKRKKGKIANFSLLYGGSPWTLQSSSGLPFEECEDIYNRYWGSLKVLDRWKNNKVREAHENGGVAYTAYGRPRRLKHWLTSPVGKLKAFGRRSVASHIIQGTSGDIMRICLCRFFNQIWPKYGENENLRFVNAVHDEIDFVVRRDIADEVFCEVRDMMGLRPPGCELDLKTSLEIGTSYGYMFEFERNDDGKYEPIKA